MKVGKITAKLRDAVPVCFMVEGDEIIRFKNIEMPEALKELEMRDFGFSIQGDGRIDFNIQFEPGILPESFPAKRERKHRTPKPDAMAAMPQVGDAAGTPESAADVELGQDAPTEPVDEAAMELVSEPEIVQEAASEPEVAAEPETTPEPEAEPTAEPMIEAEPEAEAATEPEIATEPETTAEPEIATEPEAEATPEPMIETEPEEEPATEKAPKAKRGRKPRQ